MSLSSLNSVSQYPYSYYNPTDANPIQPYPLIRQTTEEMVDDLVSLLFQTPDDIQSIEDSKERAISHESTSSSHLQPQSLLNHGNHGNPTLDNQPPQSISLHKKRKVREKDQTNQEELDSDENELSLQDRKTRNRETAAQFRLRQKYYIEKLEEANNGTLELGKRLSQALKHICVPLNFDIDSSHNPQTEDFPKIKYNLSETEKKYESIQKTHQWIESTFESMVREKNTDVITRMVKKIEEQNAELLLQKISRDATHESLTSEIAQLRAQNQNLLEKLTSATVTNESLTSENAQLKAQNRVLSQKDILLQSLPGFPFMPTEDFVFLQRNFKNGV